MVTIYIVSRAMTEPKYSTSDQKTAVVLCIRASRSSDAILETFYYLPEWFRKPQRAQSTQRKIRTLCALCGDFFKRNFQSVFEKRDFLLSSRMVRKTTENIEKKQRLSVSSVVNFLCHDSFHPEFIKKSPIQIRISLKQIFPKGNEMDLLIPDRHIQYSITRLDLYNNILTLYNLAKH